MRKYFGAWVARDDLAKDFDTPEVAADAEILLASYEQGGYEGDAFVLFERNGKMYEVHGGHCSCYGLEGQWTPEETSVEAIKMRPEPLEYHSKDAQTALSIILNQRA